MSTAPRSAKIMTFAELMTNPHRRRSVGSCRFCSAYDTDGWFYGVRHKVCAVCAKARGNDTLPSVLKNERAARRFAKDHPDSARFVATIAGVNIEYAEWAIKEHKRTAKPLGSHDGRGVAL